jgi:hypothetical protein
MENRLNCRSARIACLLMLAAIVGMAAENGSAGGPTVMRRLTAAQYRNIVTDVFGEEIALGGRFEPDLRVNQLLAVGAGQASVTAAGLEQYDKIARSVGTQVVDAEHRSQMIECKPRSLTEPDDACTRIFLARVGRLLYSRPLSSMELQGYVESAATATRKTGDYYNGLVLALAAVLEAPEFLFRMELSEPDPAHLGQRRLDAYSKAQRLSFLFWNTAPDSTLLAAAEKGDLHTPEGLAKQVDRLLDSPRFESGVRAFFGDMLQLDGFDTLAKDAALYPKFTFAAARQAQEQTLRTLIDLLITSNGDYRDIFTARKTFLTPLLGALYRVPVLTPDGLPNAWVPYEFSADSGQSGILTHASFVGLHSHPGRSSPTLRGRALREVFLCTKIPDPPANVDFSRFEDSSGRARTARERLEAHRNNPACAACHKITDPIGLSLETFDAAGGPRKSENGAAIDTSGELDGESFTNAAGLGKAMHDNPGAATCLVQRTLDYALGRTATAGEKAWRAEYLDHEFANNGYRYPALLRSIAMSDTFYRVISSKAQDMEHRVAAAIQDQTQRENRR